MMRWMALGLMIGTIVGVPEALVRRAMRFRELGAAQVLSYASGYLGVGITWEFEAGVSGAWWQPALRRPQACCC